SGRSGPFRGRCPFQRTNMLGQIALRTLHQFESDLGTLAEGAEALHFDGRKVREHVCAAPFGFDESEPLRIVKPFHASDRHRTPPHEFLCVQLFWTSKFWSRPKGMSRFCKANLLGTLCAS